MRAALPPLISGLDPAWVRLTPLDRARCGAGAQIRDQLRDMRLRPAIQKHAFRVLRGKTPPAIRSARLIQNRCALR